MTLLTWLINERLINEMLSNHAKKKKNLKQILATRLLGETSNKIQKSWLHVYFNKSINEIFSAGILADFIGPHIGWRMPQNPTNRILLGFPIYRKSGLSQEAQKILIPDGPIFR